MSISAHPSPSRRRGWIPWIFLASGAAVIVLYYLQPSRLGYAIIYEVTGVAGVAAIVCGIHLNKPRGRGSWYLAAFGLTASVTGDVIWSYYEHVLKREAPYPSVADAFYIGGSLLLAAALAGFVRRRLPGRDVGSLIDAIIITTGAGIVSWMFLVTPYAADRSLTLAVRLTAISYPLVDIVLIAFAARLALAPGRRSVSLHLLLLMLTAWILVDSLYGWQSLAGTYLTPSPLDVGWMGGYILLGTLALHPSMRHLTEATREPAPSLTLRRVILLAAAASLAPIVIAVQAVRGDPVQITVVVPGATALFLLVVLRLAGVARALGAAARNDGLTGLANRAHIMEQLDGSLARARRDGTEVALLFVDLDRFKRVNDTLGHEAGDRLLIAVAGLLRDHTRGGDTVARLGGDEFVVVCPAVGGLARATDIAERIQTALAEPIYIDAIPVFISASIGVAIADPRDDGETLVQDADLAMYRAKESGRARYHVFDPGLRADSLSRRAMERELQAALERDEFAVRYQPVVRLHDNQVVGVEALIRWDHPDRGMLTPYAFLDEAEESGLIVPIGAWLFREVADQLALWRRTIPGGEDVRASVNLSARQLLQMDLAEVLLGAVASAGLTPDALCLEVTESALLDDLDHASMVLGRLRAHGFHVSVDDFGTGYSSLSYLKHLPVQTMKIDRSFVVEIGSGTIDLAILRTLLDLARAVEIDVIVEGVETLDQLEILGRLGVGFAQGFVWSEPLSPERCARVLGAPLIPTGRGGVLASTGR